MLPLLLPLPVVYLSAQLPNTSSQAISACPNAVRSITKYTPPGLILCLLVENFSASSPLCTYPPHCPTTLCKPYWPAQMLAARCITIHPKVHCSWPHIVFAGRKLFINVPVYLSTPLPNTSLQAILACPNAARCITIYPNVLYCLQVENFSSSSLCTFLP